MELVWVREDTPVWDVAKQAIVGGAPAGTLDVPPREPGELAPGEWFHVESAGAIVAFGWMDCTWGDAEVTLAVDAKYRGQGVGAFILSHLEKEAAARGVNYLYNTVRATHPEAGKVTRWLENLGFQRSGDGLLKKRVGR